MRRGRPTLKWVDCVRRDVRKAGEKEDLKAVQIKPAHSPKYAVQPEIETPGGRWSWYSPNVGRDLTGQGFYIYIFYSW